MDDIEARVAALEATNIKYRAALTAALVALAFVAIAAPMQGVPQQQSYPRHIVADSITVQTLNAYSGHISQSVSDRSTVGYADIRDGNANSLAVRTAAIDSLESNDARFVRAVAAVVEIRDKRAPGGVRLTTTSVALLGPQERPAATLSLEGDSGILSVFGKGGFLGFKATADAENGTAAVFNGRGFALASLDATDKGDGRVVAHTRNGNKVAMLEADDSGQYGVATVRKQGGESMAKLEATEKMGRLTICLLYTSRCV